MNLGKTNKESKLINHFLLGLVFFFAYSMSLAQSSNLQLNAVLIESSDLLQAGETQAALALLKRYEADYSSQPEFLNNLAIAYLGDSQPIEAITILRQLVEADPVFSIVAHNLLELELQLAEGPPETINPVLFVQSTQSFFETEIANLAQNESSSNTSTTSIATTEVATQELPSTTAPLTEDLIESADSEEIIRLTQDWATAWSNKNLESYLGFYAENYQPNSETSTAQWKANRDSSLNRPGDISVELSNLTGEIQEDRGEVRFEQTYRSANYSDRVEKTLVYSRLEGEWKIVSETSITLD